jgi:hypothetical protein
LDDAALPATAVDRLRGAHRTARLHRRRARLWRGPARRLRANPTGGLSKRGSGTSSCSPSESVPGCDRRRWPVSRCVAGCAYDLRRRSGSSPRVPTRSSTCRRGLEPCPSRPDSRSCTTA